MTLSFCFNEVWYLLWSIVRWLLLDTILYHLVPCTWCSDQWVCHMWVKITSYLWHREFQLLVSGAWLIPICTLAACDRGRSVWTCLPCKICISDCKVPFKGVFLYTIRAVYGDWPSSFALWNRFLMIPAYFSASPLLCSIMGRAGKMVDRYWLH